MECKIEQTRNAIISKIQENNKESTLIQRNEDDNRTHIIYELNQKTDNMIVTKRIEYVF